MKLKCVSRESSVHSTFAHYIIFSKAALQKRGSIEPPLDPPLHDETVNNKTGVIEPDLIGFTCYTQLYSRLMRLLAWPAFTYPHFHRAVKMASQEKRTTKTAGKV